MTGKKESLIKGKPSRLGGGRHRDGYILRIWMGASAGPFSNRTAIGWQPLWVFFWLDYHLSLFTDKLEKWE
jgi:hypothetical protein